MPQRIQRRRDKGWRMPEGAVYVGRPTRWGNPWQVRRDNGLWWVYQADRTCWTSLIPQTQDDARDYAVRYFRGWITHGKVVGHSHPRLKALSVQRDFIIDHVWADLRGRDLACWCPLDAPCHADVLLDLANRPAVSLPIETPTEEKQK